MATEDRPPQLFAPFAPRDANAPRPALPTGLSIEQAKPADLPALTTILWNREGGQRHIAEDRVRTWLDASAESNRIFVARLESEILGYARIVYVTPDTRQRDDRQEGWYLTGVVVDPARRRRGIAEELTRRRLTWLSGKAEEVYYFANSINRASIALHDKFAFKLILRDIRVPGCVFSGGGIGLLFRASLSDQK